jgi:hypothetical protein
MLPFAADRWTNANENLENQRSGRDRVAPENGVNSESPLPGFFTHSGACGGATILPGDSRNAHRRSRHLPQATSWLQYDYYDFLTRPELRPPDPTGRKAFWRTIETTRSRLTPVSVLEGLDETRQLELAALVVDCIADHEMYGSFRKGMEAFRGLSALLGARNIATIERAARLLRPLAATVPEHHPYAPGVDLKELVAALEDFLRQWPWRNRRDAAEYIRWAGKNYPQTNDPTNEITVKLFSFFVSECALAKNEAEVRVAKIGNACLKWNVKYTESYAGDESWKGCPTIRQRVARFQNSTAHG